MTVFEIVLLALSGVVVIALLKNNGSVYSSIVQIALVVIIIISVIPQAKELLSAVDGVNLSKNVSNEALKVMMKIFGILTVGSIVADICRDNGESAVANTVELSVKVLALACAMPVFTAVVALASSFIG